MSKWHLEMCSPAFSPSPGKAELVSLVLVLRTAECPWEAEVKGAVKGKEPAQFTVSPTLPAGMGPATFLQSFISVLCSEGWRKCTKKLCSLQNRPRRLFAVNKNFHPSHLCPINVFWRAHIFKRQLCNASVAGKGEKAHFCSVVKWYNIADLPSGTFPVCISP